MSALTTRELAGIPLDSAFSDPGLSQLAPVVPFWKGQWIGQEGQDCRRVFVLVRGQVLLSHRGSASSNRSLHLLGPGDLFGEDSLFPEQLWKVSARALTDAAAHSLPAAQLPRFGQSFPRLTAHLLGLLARRVDAAHRRLDLMSTDCAKERVLGLLRLLAGGRQQQRSGYVPVEAQLTQAQMGEMLGLARETVARALADLEKIGAIRREGRSAIWLKSHLLGSMLAVTLLLRVVGLPGLAVLTEDAGCPQPRGRRGRTHGAVLKPRFTLGACGPDPHPVAGT